MKRLRVDEIAGILPELDELRPLLDRIYARAEPDPDRAWSGSGELGTVGDRIVPAGALDGSAEALADEVRDHLRGVYDSVGGAVRSLARGATTDAAEALLDAADREERARHLGRAEAYARAAHHIVRGERDGRIRARCLRRLGRALRSQGRLEEGARRYEEAYRIGTASRAARDAATAAIGRGNIAIDRGRWSEAEEWYDRAAALLEGEEPGPEQWHVELNRSIVAYRRGEFERSREHLDRAEEVAGRVGDASAGPIVENAWGRLLAAEQQTEAAAERLRGALEAAEDPTARVTIAVNLGECLLDLGQPLDAGELARDAERTALREGVVPKLPEVYRLLGRVARAQGHADAIVFYERALDIVRHRDLPAFERAQTLEEYSSLESDAGRTGSARTMLEEALALYRDLGMKEAEQRIAALLEEAGTKDGHGSTGPQGAGYE